MKKEIDLPVADPLHLAKICSNAVLGAFVMNVPLEFKVSIDGDNMTFTMVADVSEEEAAALDEFQEFAHAALREMIAEESGSTATVN